MRRLAERRLGCGGIGLCLLTWWGLVHAQPGVVASDAAPGQSSTGQASPPPTGSFPSPESGEQAPSGATSPPGAASASGAVPAPPAEPASVAPAAPITPELLELCTSVDFKARHYCLMQLERAPALPPAAQGVLHRLANSDPDLHGRAGALYRRLYAAEPPPYSPVPREADDSPPALSEARERALPPGDPMRVVFAPTAFTRPTGVVGFNAFELGTGTLDVGVAEGVELGVQSAIPLGFVALGGLAKFALAFEGLAVGLRAHALVIKPLADVEPITLYGAGPMLTIGDYETYFNVGSQFYGSNVDDDALAIALPNVGGSIRLSGSTRLNAELYLPTGLGDAADLDLGDFMALLWGIRLFGDHLWGDIALLDPICDGCSEIYETIPLGIPFLNLGGNW